MTLVRVVPEGVETSGRRCPRCGLMLLLADGPRGVAREVAHDCPHGWSCERGCERCRALVAADELPLEDPERAMVWGTS